jgi:CRISPR-associated protein Cas2
MMNEKRTPDLFIVPHSSFIVRLMFIVISYDITDDKRRARVYEELKDHGAWVQYSVFECDLTAEQIKRLQATLAKLLNPRQDSIRYYYLCQSCVVKCEVQGVTGR